MAKRFDFSEDLEPIEIVYNGDLFLVSAEAPADTIADLAAMMNSTTDSEKVNALKEFMFQILLPEYVDAYRARLGNPEKPIGFKALMKTFETLVEHYTTGLGEDDATRPTEEASSSQTGLAETGTTSTESSVSAVEPIPAVSASVAS
jgi:hypothetical protein